MQAVWHGSEWAVRVPATRRKTVSGYGKLSPPSAAHSPAGDFCRAWQVFDTLALVGTIPVEQAKESAMPATDLPHRPCTPGSSSQRDQDLAIKVGGKLQGIR